MSDESSVEQVFNSVQAYYAVARALHGKREYRRALNYLELSLKADDRHIPSYILRSICYLRLTETEKALADIRKVLEYEKKNPHALLLLAEIYYQRGDFEEALTAFHRGRKLRPTIEQFVVGVHKCEIAIRNSCGYNYAIHLSPDMDLTDFYMRAFPPKREVRSPRRLMAKTTKPDADDVPPWPTARPDKIQQQLMKQSFVDFNYLGGIYNDEGVRSQQFKGSGCEMFPELAAIMERSKDNRKTAVGCGEYLDRRAELYHKLDPGLRNTKGTL